MAKKGIGTCFFCGRAGRYSVEYIGLFPKRLEAVTHLAEKNGRIVVERLCVGAPPGEELPDAGITARDLRRIRVGGVIETAWLIEKLAWEKGETQFTAAAMARLKDARKSPQGRRRSDDFYAERARAYLEALKHDPRAPIKWMVKRERGKGVRHQGQESRIRDEIRGARVRGFLSPTRRGIPGGEPTRELLEWEKKQRPPRKGRRKGGS